MQAFWDIVKKLFDNINIEFPPIDDYYELMSFISADNAHDINLIFRDELIMNAIYTISRLGNGTADSRVRKPKKILLAYLMENFTADLFY